MLCSLSGGAVTPESQLEESTSPADTTEDDPLPLKPWGRSQSLPAYADLIMVGTRDEPRSKYHHGKAEVMVGAGIFYIRTV